MTDTSQSPAHTSIELLAQAIRQLAAVHGAVVDQSWQFQRTMSELYALGETLLAARLQLQRDQNLRR